MKKLLTALLSMLMFVSSGGTSIFAGYVPDNTKTYDNNNGEETDSFDEEDEQSFTIDQFYSVDKMANVDDGTLDYYVSVTWETTNGTAKSNGDLYHWDASAKKYVLTNITDELSSNVPATMGLIIKNQSNAKVDYEISYSTVDGYDTSETSNNAKSGTIDAYDTGEVSTTVHTADAPQASYNDSVTLNKQANTINNEKIGVYTVTISASEKAIKKQTVQQTLNTSNSDEKTTLSTTIAPVKNGTTTIELPNSISELASNNSKVIQLTETATPIVPASSQDGFEVLSNSNAIAIIDLNLTVDGASVSDFKDSNNNDKTVKVTTATAKGLTNVVVKYAGTDNKAQVDQSTVQYNASTGELSFKTSHFSKFVVGADQKAYNTDTNTAYDTLVNAITNANSGDTIYLLKDEVGNGIGSSDGTKTRESLVVDFNEHTYTVNGGTVGSVGTTTQAMHWGSSLGTITLKNGSFNVAENVETCKMAAQIYIPFNAENMAFDFSNIAVIHYGEYTGENAKYSNHEVSIFNFNGTSGTLTNCVFNFNEDASLGISFASEDHNVVLNNTTINGSAFGQDNGDTLKMDATSKITKGIISYFSGDDAVSFNETNNDGYRVYTAVSQNVVH